MMRSIFRKLIPVLALLAPAVASAAADIVVHRDPGCGCCAKWAAMLRKEFGRRVTMIEDPQRSAFRKRAGIPRQLSSCHTALIDGLLFEGHVPIADMRRLLAQRPKGVSGLAVPGMPLGSPGMEVPSGKTQIYEVLAFGPAGYKVFARHGR